MLPIVASVAGFELTDDEKYWLAKNQPAGISFFDNNIKNKQQFKKLLDQIKDVTDNEKILLYIDQEGGQVCRLAGQDFRTYAPEQRLGQISPKATRLHAGLISADFKELGLNMNCAPVLDVLRHDTTHDTVFVLDGFDKLPKLIFLDFALYLPTADLLVESIKKLLTGGRTGKASAFVLLTAEIAQVKDTFRRAGERHTHAVKHLYEFGRGLNHALDGDLIRQKVTAVNGVIKVLINAVVLTFGIHTGVDTALSAKGVGAFYRAIRKQVHLAAALTNLESGHKPGQPTAYDDYFIFRFRCHIISPVATLLVMCRKDL